MAGLEALTDEQLFALREQALASSAAPAAGDLSQLSDEELSQLRAKAAAAADPRGPAGFGDRMVDAFTFGLGKDAASLAKTGPREVASWFTGEPYDFSSKYGQAREAEQARLDAYSEENPGKGLAADAAGIVSGGALFKAPQAATALGRVGQAAKEGAIAGGLTGFGDAEGDLTDRAIGAATGAGIGGTVGAVATPVLEGVTRLGGRLLGGATPRPAPGVDPAARISDAAAYGIPLTRGQATGNLRQQAAEEAMRHAARGEGPARTLQQFDTTQTDAMRRAADTIQDSFSTGGPRFTGDADVGDTLAASVQARAAGLKQTAGRFYDDAQSYGARIGADVAEAAPQDVARRLAAENFRFDQSLHPTAFAALADIESLGAAGARAGAPVTHAGQAVNPKSIDFSEAHDLLKRLNQLRPASAADGLALGKVKRAYNAWWDDAVDAQLFSGSEQALDAVRKGNRNYSEYLALTRPKTGDDAGRVLKKMATGNVTGQEVANWIYGASIMRPPGQASRVASRLKQTFGETSEEWSAVRQGAWLRLVGSSSQKPRGPQAISTDLLEFLDGRGKAVADVLFTATERNQMRGFAKVLKTMVADPKATNPSKSSYGVSRLFRATVAPIAAALGFSAGGAGAALGALAVVPAARGVVANRAAQNAINPLLRAPLFQGSRSARLGGNALANYAGEYAATRAPAPPPSVPMLGAR